MRAKALVRYLDSALSIDSILVCLNLDWCRKSLAGLTRLQVAHASEAPSQEASFLLPLESLFDPTLLSLWLGRGFSDIFVSQQNVLPLQVGRHYSIMLREASFRKGVRGTFQQVSGA